MTDNAITNNYRVFEVLESTINLPLADRARLAALECSENFLFTCNVSDLIQDINFFRMNKYNFEFVQNSEILIFDHLDLKLPFIAYEKANNSSYCPKYEKRIRTLWAYTPK